MKKNISYILLTLFAVITLSSCAANTRCTYDAAIPAMKQSSEVYAYIYANEKGYTVSGDKISEMISGEWIEASKSSDFEKKLSVMIDTQYEVCFFADGTAMIYCGFADTLQKDRQYYKCTTATDVDEICKYVAENGVEVKTENKGQIGAAE